jgi:hypothetical protein
METSTGSMKPFSPSDQIDNFALFRTPRSN